ncbi:helix-turn-helix domain-containing protein [Bradyrhizobium cenepequi]|uniref:helix-turn-helix domain-containing protein n=1 Tax=Bradyrhizobium cenepequi TaxID=2821403 RepID=UPI001CE38E52|nr:helix-turn-helix transcriptional regulator [Bradyrhizobium cenepequi]MCA6108972.1 helix-turn-helix transcriptional regulator [Bradyrhizobium cenepequi]
MKLTSEERRALLASLRQRINQRSWTTTDLARNTGVHQSQVSRIIRGDFKTLSSNVLQICITLGVEIDARREGDQDEDDRRQIASSAMAIWNGTHQDAGIVVSLLLEIAKLRRTDRRR